MHRTAIMINAALNPANPRSNEDEKSVHCAGVGWPQRKHPLNQQNAALEARAQQATAPAPTAAIPGARMTVRLTEPRRYSGKSAEDPEEYLNSVEQYFLLGGVADDRQRIMLAGQFLQDNARDWFLVAYKTTDMVANPAAFTWTDFKDALRQRFVARDAVDTARAKLFRLYQGRMNLRDYTLQFQYLATRAGTVSDADLKVLYLDRMDQTVAVQVGMRFPATLAETIHMAEQWKAHSQPITPVTEVVTTDRGETRGRGVDDECTCTGRLWAKQTDLLAVGQYSDQIQVQRNGVTRRARMPRTTGQRLKCRRCPKVCADKSA